GPLKKELIDYTRELKIDDKVHLKGKVPNIQKCIKDSTVFVLSSDYEGMPNALIEAMTLGIPCVATDTPSGGPAEVIKNGYNGYLVPIKNVNELKDAIQKLLK